MRVLLLAGVKNSDLALGASAPDVGLRAAISDLGLRGKTHHSPTSGRY